MLRLSLSDDAPVDALISAFPNLDDASIYTADKVVHVVSPAVQWPGLKSLDTDLNTICAWDLRCPIRDLRISSEVHIVDEPSTQSRWSRIFPFIKQVKHLDWCIRIGPFRTDDDDYYDRWAYKYVTEDKFPDAEDARNHVVAELPLVVVPNWIVSGLRPYIF